MVEEGLVRERGRSLEVKSLGKTQGVTEGNRDSVFPVASGVDKMLYMYRSQNVEAPKIMY